MIGLRGVFKIYIINLQHDESSPTRVRPHVRFVLLALHGLLVFDMWPTW